MPEIIFGKKKEDSISKPKTKFIPCVKSDTKIISIKKCDAVLIGKIDIADLDKIEKEETISDRLKQRYKLKEKTEIFDDSINVTFFSQETEYYFGIIKKENIISEEELKTYYPKFVYVLKEKGKLENMKDLDDDFIMKFFPYSVSDEPNDVSWIQIIFKSKEDKKQYLIEI